MATSRDPKETAGRLGRLAHDFARRCGRTTRASSSWRTRARRSSGFADTGAMWRAKYDMPPDAFTPSSIGLWDQVRPLYLSLHALRADEAAREVRRRGAGERADSRAPAWQHLGAGLVERLPARRAARTPIPATRSPTILKARKMTAVDMVRTGERFFTSLGFAPLPQTFWERSLFVKPRDREVVCHASAWDVDNVERSAHQDVHRAERRRLHDDPSRAGPQLLPARLQHAAVALPRQRERRLPRGDRRHDRAVGHAGIPREDRPARQGARSRRATSACCCRRRSRRSRSCRSAC